MINPQIFFIYLAVGSLTKLLTIKNPAPGHTWIAGLEVVLGGYTAALVVPPELNQVAAALILIPHTSYVAGHVVRLATDKTRLWLDARQNGRTN